MAVAAWILGTTAILLWISVTECSYFSRRLLLLMYNCTGWSYESKWRLVAYNDSRLTQSLFLAPILQVAAGESTKQVLDLACGTGRISLLLISVPEFQGQILAIDQSGGMLRRFREHLDKLAPGQRNRVMIAQFDLNKWTSEGSACYDAVTLLEVGELLPRFENVVAEIAKVLKPGGLLLLTRLTPRYAWMFFGRPQGRQRFDRLLKRNGFTDIRFTPWRSRYEVVYARK